MDAVELVVGLLIMAVLAFVLFVAFSIGSHSAEYKILSAVCERDTGGECRRMKDKRWLVDKDGEPSYWMAP